MLGGHGIPVFALHTMESCIYVTPFLKHVFLYVRRQTASAPHRRTARYTASGRKAGQVGHSKSTKQTLDWSFPGRLMNGNVSIERFESEPMHANEGQSLKTSNLELFKDTGSAESKPYPFLTSTGIRFRSLSVSGPVFQFRIFFEFFHHSRKNSVIKHR